MDMKNDITITMSKAKAKVKKDVHELKELKSKVKKCVIGRQMSMEQRSLTIVGCGLWSIEKN